MDIVRSNSSRWTIVLKTVTDFVFPHTKAVPVFDLSYTKAVPVAKAVLERIALLGPHNALVQCAYKSTEVGTH